MGHWPLYDSSEYGHVWFSRAEFSTVLDLDMYLSHAGKRKFWTINK